MVLGALSVVLHGPWRRWVGKARRDGRKRDFSTDVQAERGICPDLKEPSALHVVEVEEGRNTGENDQEFRQRGNRTEEGVMDQITVAQ